MDKVLRDHPTSAKAHYVEAELLGKQGRLHDAETELNTAERLDPSHSFANQQKINELQSLISGTRSTMQRAQPAYSRQVVRAGGNPPWVTPLIIIGLIALFFFIVRALGRRNTVMAGGYPVGYGPGGAVQSYGPGMGPMGGGMMGGQGGMGSGILGGLATGAALGAGMVAGEELMHHFTDRDRNETIYETPPSQNIPDDMGGSDFGVSDSSSWDSGGGGGGDW
ncbi:MAG: tetratricopeptide repeat protein, partial [Burkholderiales bacterium]